MKELIKITTRHNTPVVSARDLHAFLEIETPITKWVKRMSEYGFKESIDWTKLSTEGQQVEYGLTIDCAKHWAMMQRSEKGMQARNYFIECEKKLVLGQFSLPKTFSEALQLAADQAKELESKKEEIALLDKLVDTLEPKAKVYNQISESETLLSLNDAAKSIGMGRNRMMEDLRNTKILRVNNVPYQSYIDRELFEVKIKSITIGSNQKNYAQTFVTGKGLTWLSKRYPKNEDKETTPKVKTI